MNFKKKVQNKVFEKIKLETLSRGFSTSGGQLIDRENLGREIKINKKAYQRNFVDIRILDYTSHSRIKGRYDLFRLVYPKLLVEVSKHKSS